MEEKQFKPLKKVQLVSYGLGDMASQFVWTFVGSYLTVFYSDIVGLAPAAISAIMLIARIWDAINDPMMGAIAERTHSKWGRFRPYIAFGCPFLALFGVLTFTAPFGNERAGVIWAAVTYIIAGMLYTLVNIPYSSLAGVMTTDANERNMLNSFRSAGMFVGMLIINFAASNLMLAFSGGAEVANKHGYLMAAVVFSTLSVPLFLIVFKMSREVIPAAPGQNKMTVGSVIKNLVTNKYLMLISLIMVFQMTGYMGRIAVTAFYVIYDMGSFTLIAMIMVIPSLAGIVGSLLTPVVSKAIGKKRTLMIGMLLEGVGLLIVFFSPYTSLGSIVAGHIIYGIGGVVTPVMLSMVADSVDYFDLKHGVRTDGTAYATYGLASKLGNAIGGAVGVLLLAAFGYVANAQQTVQAQNGINIVVNLLPAILFFVGMIIACFWDMSDKDSDEIREKLTERNEKAEEEK